MKNSSDSVCRRLSWLKNAVAAQEVASSANMRIPLVMTPMAVRGEQGQNSIQNSHLNTSMLEIRSD